MNLDVCEQAEQGSSPIRTAPGVSVVEALISLLGQPLMHVANHLTPDALSGEIAGAKSRNRLDVHRRSLFDPVVLARNRRKREVHHLVRQHPVAFEFCGIALSANGYANQSTVVHPERVSIVNTATIKTADLEGGTGKRKTPIVGDDGIAGVVNPGHQFALRGLREVRIEIYINGATANFKGWIAMRGKRQAEHEKDGEYTAKHRGAHLDGLREFDGPREHKVIRVWLRQVCRLLTLAHLAVRGNG